MSNLGNITTSSEKIIRQVAKVVSGTYGVIGVSSKDIISEGMGYLASHHEYAKGIVLSEDNSQLNLEVYIVIAFDFKADIVLKSLEQNIRWELKNQYQVELNEIKFFITNVGRIK